MTKIFKYQIPVLERFTLDLPRNADIIRTDSVDGKFYVWAVVNPENEIETRKFQFHKTGSEIKTEYDNLKYIGYCTLFIQQELCLYLFEDLS